MIVINKKFQSGKLIAGKIAVGLSPIKQKRLYVPPNGK